MSQIFSHIFETNPSAKNPFLSGSICFLKVPNESIQAQKPSV
ncbi:hypothetical protein VIBNISO65_1430004 [Vibrio nigripulchritudo SO65]|nr:hypothetical protein VIBNIFTn2_1630118 [Vibrio nigripulchritudo FTn2]CCN64240.1 hypothetical protein VIBNIPon4_20118 [Vibrio nigripulchritudo POn4]CCN75694.1 hypothetical protein VIBNISO65_1430004 [Vibrio nigripulchritudo SO65]